MAINDRIGTIRKINNLSQVAFSSKISISRNSLINYEKGSRTPSVDVLIRISEEFKIPCTDLISSTLTVPSVEASYSDQPNLVNETTVSKESTEEESLAAFKRFLDINSFPIYKLNSAKINKVHERAMEYIEFQFSKLGVNLKDLK